MHTWSHSGHEIAIGDDAHFWTTLNGRKLRSASLAAIKARIDKEGEFTPFPILDFWEYPTHPIEEKTIIRCEEGRFVDAAFKHHHRVAADTPENRAAVAAYRDTYQRNKDMIADLDREIEEEKAKVAILRPGETT